MHTSTFYTFLVDEFFATVKSLIRQIYVTLNVLNSHFNYFIQLLI